MSRLICCRAPVRIDFAGGGSDAPPFCIDHGGAVLNAAISHHVHVQLEVRESSPAVHIASEDFHCETAADSLADLAIDGVLDLPKAVARRMAPPWGFRLAVRSDVPPGSGLGSSGALGVALVAAFARAMGLDISRGEIARTANSVERRDLGYPGGCQDSYPPAFGGIGLVRIAPGGMVGFEPQEIPDAIRYELERRLVLAYTGAVHLSGSIHADIRESYGLPDSPVLDAMGRLAELAEEAAAALRQGDLAAFGTCLDRNWLQHQRLHPGCNCAALEEAFNAAAAWVDGAKTCGAGGGRVRGPPDARGPAAPAGGGPARGRVPAHAVHVRPRGGPDLGTPAPLNFARRRWALRPPAPGAQLDS